MTIAIAIVFIGFGVTLLLAAIVGGDIEFSKLKIPSIVGPGKRALTGCLGALLLLCAVLFNSEFFQPSDDQPPNRGIPSPGSATTPPPPPPPPIDRTTLVGTVALSHHTVDFWNLHTDFWIMASAGPASEVMGVLDAQGQFRIDDVPAEPQHTVLWGVSGPRDFVIWPLIHPEVSIGADLRGFRFQRLHDVFVNEKNRMLEAVTAGNFIDADERLSDILQLFERLGGAHSRANDSITEGILRWRFTLPRDLAKAAHDFRIAGRGTLTDSQVQVERAWRRMAINAALEQPAAGQQYRDLVRAMNSWSAYARHVSRRAQRSRPDRSLTDRQAREGFAEHVSHEELLIEDIALIMDRLAIPEIEEVVSEHIASRSQRARLSDGQQDAVASFAQLLERDPDRVSLNQLGNLLSALHKLVGTEQSVVDRADGEPDIVSSIGDTVQESSAAVPLGIDTINAGVDGRDASVDAPGEPGAVGSERREHPGESPH